MKKYLFILLIMVMAVGLFHGFSQAEEAEMGDYCIVPPYVKRDIPPNIFILLDNSYVNGLPAYSSASEGALTEPVTNLMKYDPDKQYSGLFKSTDWYYYDGSEFVPASNDPSSPNYNSNAVFEGNLLNWATTSNYDLIMYILEGGVSTSRQTNVNTLVGYNSGTWENKIFVYEGTKSYTITDPVTGTTSSTNMYACEFIVDTDLVISDSVTYKNDLGYICGLILDSGDTPAGPVGPTAAYTYLSDAGDVPDGHAYASLSGGTANAAAGPVKVSTVSFPAPADTEEASVTASAPSREADSGRGLLSRTFNLLNRMISSGAETADAAPALNLNTPKSNGSLPDATIFYDYMGASSFACAATGGYGYYRWSATGLPSGMSIDPVTGMIDGTPADTPGTFTPVSVTVTDYTDDTYSTVNTTATAANVSLVLAGELVRITAPRDLSNPTSVEYLTDAYSGQPYAGYYASATGGTGTYKWFATGLPPGMSIDFATGLISGTPIVSVSGTYQLFTNIVITVDDGFSTATPTNTIYLRVYRVGGDLQIMRPADVSPYPDLPEAQKGFPYVGYTPIAEGGTPPYSWYVWGLPPGMSYDPATGKIFGTPGGSGNFTYTIGFRVTDSLGATDNEYGYLYESRTGADVQITWPYNYYYLWYLIENQTYTNRFTPAAQGGSGIYTWSSPNLPAGLLMDEATGRIYGTPTGPQGSSTFTIAVTDGTTADSVYVRYYTTYERNYIYYINVPPAMPSARLGVDYGGFSLGAYGGYGQYDWSVTGLPPGMSYDAKSGVVTGTPSAAGDFEVTFTVSSTNPVTLQTVLRVQTLDFQVLAPAAPVIINPPYNKSYIAYNGVPIEGVLPEAIGGTGVYTWTVNNLPNGLTYDPATGYISGTPAESFSGTYYKSYDIEIIVDDGVYKTSSTVRMGVYTVYINYPGSSWMPTATEGSEYEGFSFSARYGAGALSWSAWNLPPGMTLDPATGFLSGSPATDSAGTYFFSVTVTDGTATYTLYSNIEVAAPGFAINQKSFNIRVCAGTAAENCNNSGKVLKEGLLQIYFREPPEDDLAHFGLVDFRSAAVPAVEECIRIDVDPENETVVGNTNESSFHTAVENAVPTVSSNNLVNGVYEAVRAYMGDPYQPASSTCDPFTDSGGDLDIQACRRNFLLILTDGEGADKGNLVFGQGDTRFDRSQLPEKCQGATSNMGKNACFAFRYDLRSETLGVLVDGSPIEGTQNMSTYVVHATPNPEVNHDDILKEVASYSGGVYYGVTDPAQLRDTLSEALKDIIKRAASGTAASVLASAEGETANLLQAVYYPRKRFIDSSEGKEDEIAWIGRMANYWYWVDPYFVASNMREETKRDNIMNLTTDLIAALYFDPIEEQVKANRWKDDDADGYADSVVPLYPDLDFESLGAIWEVGVKLWQRDLSSNPRKIYVNLEGAGATFDTARNMSEFNTILAGDSIFQALLNVSDRNSNGTVEDEAKDVIYFLHGDEDSITGTARSRKVKVDFNGDGDSADTNPLGTGDPFEDETVARVWKLGDIINSTPTMLFWQCVTGYHLRYKPLNKIARWNVQDYIDYCEYEIDKQRNMVFAGGNDGMLHAFRLGQLVFPGQDEWPYGYTKGTQGALLGNGLGEEVWSFIPKNSLPYLQYMLRSDYCHLYYNDMTPYIVDVPIARDPEETDALCPPGTDDYWKCTRTQKTWRTILIGGMRFGGACKNQGTACTEDLNGDGDVNDEDCVKTPIQDVGYSSYYALDISDADNPVFMWEFSHPDLGYSTTNASVLRIAEWTDLNSNGIKEYNEINNDKNGRFFAVFGAGPTGPITSEDQTYQFLGRSDQNLKFFVLDIKTGDLLEVIDTGLNNAFAGNLVETSYDIDLNGVDDAFYSGYTQLDSATGTWTDGGVGRIITYENMDPATWEWWPYMENIGPVTVAVDGIGDPSTGRVWHYFATGRYFYELENEADDSTGQRHLIGVIEPCAQVKLGDTGFITSKVDCSEIIGATSRTLADLSDVTDIAGGDPDTTTGWYLRLPTGGTMSVGVDEVGNSIDIEYAAERVITDPKMAVFMKLILFTSFMPYRGGCTIGGDSFIWALEYDSGGAPGGKLAGQALLQSSTGSIEQIQLSAGEDSGFGGASGSAGGGMSDARRSRRIMGVPPVAEGFSLFSPPSPSERVIHILER